MATQRIQLERVPPRPCSNPASNTETRYRVLHEGNEIGVWRDPECSAARWLVDNGKAERVIEFMRRVQKQDNEVRAFMQRAGAST